MMLVVTETPTARFEPVRAPSKKESNLELHHHSITVISLDL